MSDPKKQAAPDPYADIPDAYADIPSAEAEPDPGDPNEANEPPEPGEAPAPMVAAPPPTAAAPPPLDMGTGDDPVGLGKRGAPMLGPSSPITTDDVTNTFNDYIRAANQGLSWDSSNKMVGLANAAARGEDPGVAIAREESLSRQAQERSPIGSTVLHTAGYVPGVLLGGANAAIGGGVTALDALLAQVGKAGIQGMVQGGLSSPGGADARKVADNIISGGRNNALLTGLLQAPGMIASKVGGFLSGGKAAPPQTLPNAPAELTPEPQQMGLDFEASPQMSLPGMATPAAPPAPPPPAPMASLPPAPPAAQPLLTAPGMRQAAARAAADPEAAKQAMGTMLKGGAILSGIGSHQHGLDPAMSALTGLTGYQMADDVARVAQGAAPPILNAAAAGIDATGKVISGAGGALQAGATMAPGVLAAARASQTLANAPRIDDMAGPVSPTAATANGRGNLLPQAAMTALQHDPAALGKYQSQFAEAMVSRDPNAVGALISRLTQSDPAFRTTVLPGLQRRTMGGDSQRPPSGY